MNRCEVCRNPIAEGQEVGWVITDSVTWVVCRGCEERNNRCAEIYWKAEPWTRPGKRKKIPLTK